ncbi:MAG: hypothetical protein WCI34_05025, partial [Actinomycetes bacterium]
MSPAELLVVAVVAVALSVLQTFPLIAHLGSSMPKDLGDPLYQAWQVAWDGHALLHQPGHFWQANHSYPLPDSLAFSDALVGYTPAGLIGSGLHAAIVRYNLLFIFIFALSFFGGWLLARELNASKAGAWVGGAAFAYSPWHFGQGGHMHVLSNGGIALALFLLIRGYRRESWKLVLAGWLAAAWQLSIGFSLGLQLILALAALAAAGVVGWVRSGRPRPAGATVISSALGIAAFGLTAALLSGPYLRVMHDYPSSVRGVAVLERTSPNLGAFFAAPATNMVWGDLTAPLRHSFAHFESEKALFPGIMILLIAMAGLGYSLWPRKLRAGLGISVLVLAVLALGIHGGALGKLLPYRLLFEFVPGWKGVRTPGRLFD